MESEESEPESKPRIKSSRGTKRKSGSDTELISEDDVSSHRSSPTPVIPAKPKVKRAIVSDEDEDNKALPKPKAKSRRIATKVDTSAEVSRSAKAMFDIDDGMGT